MTKKKETHLTAEPGLARDHEATEGCWCSPQRLFSLTPDGDLAYLHRGATSRIVHVERKEHGHNEQGHKEQRQ